MALISYSSSLQDESQNDRSIALADGGRWAKEQLRVMKHNPFVTPDKISDFYGYFRKNVVCIVGNVAYKVQNVLEICGERVIGFERDANGYDQLNLLIRNIKGLPILKMENNDRRPGVLCQR